MFCTNCGNQFPEGAGFCTNCGTRVGAAPAGVPLPQAVPTPVQIKTLNTKKIGNILGGVVLSCGVIGGIAGIFSGADTFKVVSNWLLGILFGLSVLGVIASVPLGIIFLIKGNEATNGNGPYYKKLATWVFLGPILTIISIILMYVIVNVIHQLITK